jgi:hypothetical protein
MSCLDGLTVAAWYFMEETKMIISRPLCIVAGVLTGSIVLLVFCFHGKPGVPQDGSARSPMPPTPDNTKPTGTLFISDDKRFSLWMPRTPTRENIQIPSPFGPVVCVLYQATDHKAGYMVGYTDYPADKLARFSPDKLMAMARDAIHKKYGKGVVRDEKFSYHGYGGRDLICRSIGPPKVQADMRCFMVKNRVYTVGVEHLQSTEMQGEISQYMDGFKLTQ